MNAVGWGWNMPERKGQEPRAKNQEPEARSHNRGRSESETVKAFFLPRLPFLLELDLDLDPKA